MATVIPGKTFTSNEIVTPANLNLLGTPSVVVADNEVTAAKIADGAVTQAKLNASVTLVPTGAVMPFARTTAPSGWLIANGDAVPNGSGIVQGVTANYTALYAAVSTNFGTAGTLPDLRGIFVRGSGPQTISGTTYSGTFGQKQADTVGPHTHSYDDYYKTSTLTVSYIYTTRADGSSNRVTDVSNAETGARLNNETTKSQSPASTTETRPANIALLYCIKI